MIHRNADKQMSDVNEEPIPKSHSAKEKVSFQLPVEVIMKLEEIVYHTKQEMPRDKAKQLTKSKIVEPMLIAMIWNYEKGYPRSLVKDIILYWAKE